MWFRNSRLDSSLPPSFSNSSDFQHWKSLFRSEFIFGHLVANRSKSIIQYQIKSFYFNYNWRRHQIICIAKEIMTIYICSMNVKKWCFQQSILDFNIKQNKKRIEIKITFLIAFDDLLFILVIPSILLLYPKTNMQSLH